MNWQDKWKEKMAIEPIETGQEEQEDAGREDNVRDVQESSGSTKERDRQARRAYNNSYRNKHKERVNAKRKRYDHTPKGAYIKCRNRARSKKQKWDISFENWANVWASCPKIYDDEMGVYRLAWAMRGNDIQRNTQMRRKNTAKGWTVSNVEIIYRNQPIPEHGILSKWDWANNKPEHEKPIGRFEDTQVERR